MIATILPRTLVIAGVATALLAGCAHRPPAPESRDGDVSYARVTPQAEQMRLAQDQVYQAGAIRPDDRVVPAYPAEMLSRRLPPVAVCVELYVDAAGAVYEAHPLTQKPHCPALAPELAAVFHPPAVAAVRQWRFEPAYVCQRRPGWIADDCEGEGRLREAVPVALAYRFVFRQIAGKPVVDLDVAR